MSTAAAGTDPNRRHDAGRSTRLVLLLMVVIWGLNFPIAKAALTELTPLAFNALRFPLAALTLFIALRLRGAFTWPDRSDLLRIIGLGVLGNFLYQQFFIYGLDNTRAGTASVLLAATPIVTALLSAAAGHERVGMRTWVGVAATFAGIVVIVTSGGADTTGQASVLGDVLMVAASTAWAVYTVGSRDLIGKYGPVQFTAWTLWAGTVLLCLAGLPDVLRTDLSAVSTTAWLSVVYAGALSTGLAYVFWYRGVQVIGNTRTSAYSNLVPLVALGAAWLRLGEVPTVGQLAGAAIIIGGVRLAQARTVRRRQGREPDPPPCAQTPV